MAFFARPDLDNLQFKQLSGSTLTLSGQTQIVSASGLTLTDGSGGFRPLNATGGNQGDVLTLVGDEIKFQLPSSGASTGIYTCASPTTCTVGGLSANTVITGCTIARLLEMILVPTLYPTTLSAPFNTFSIFPATTQYEVGTSISITGTSTFNRGCISPAYCGGPQYRSGLPIAHIVNFFGTDVSAFTSNLTTGLTCASYCIEAGSNAVSGRVVYSGGSQPLNSSGGSYNTPLPSGTTSGITINISGIYPYFYGSVASGGAPAGSNRPASTPALITGGTKVVASSVGTIAITFNSTSDDYIWFAIPNASTSKTKWFVDALNNGNIGGAVTPGGNLFPAFCTVTGVTSTIWSNVGCSPQTYKLYISNYQTASSVSMQLRNT